MSSLLMATSVPAPHLAPISPSLRNFGLGVAETDGAVLVGRGPGGRGPSPGSPEAPSWRPLAIGLGHRSTCLRSSTQRVGAGLVSGREPAQVAAGRGNRERLHCGEPRDFRRPAGPSTSRTPPGLGRPPLPVPEPLHVPANPAVPRGSVPIQGCLLQPVPFCRARCQSGRNRTFQRSFRQEGMTP